MPRKPRIISSSGIYHVILRSVNQHIIFEEDLDYQKFLFILSDCQKKYDIEIYAYCLMDNHIHMLLKSRPDALSSFFQSLGTKFVRWYNNKYLRSGHLFQERFHSTVIETDRSFLAALVYIHDNPVKANMCRYPSEYRWSSFNAYYGQNSNLLNISFAYGIAGSKRALHKYFAKEHGRLENDLPVEILFANDHKDSLHYFTDEKALAIFKSVTKLATTSDVTFITKNKRNEFVRTLKNKGLTIKQVARLMDVSETTVKRLCKNEPRTPSP